MYRPAGKMAPHRVVRLFALVLAALLLALWAAPVQLWADDGSSSDISRQDSSTPAEDDSAAGDGEGEGAPAEPEPKTEGLYAPEEEPAAEAACMLNVETGLFVYEKNADQPLVAASLVKMMTCILTMEYVEKYDRDINKDLVSSAGKTWIYDALYGKNASTADIRKGETLSVRELLYAALLPSANEAALLLADYVSTGYMPNFMYLMARKAEELGCTGTTFADPNGLSEENLTTARDMALIGAEFMKYPELVEIAGTSQYEMAAHEMHSEAYNIFSTNRLLVETSPYYKAFPSIGRALQAGKTGSLGEWQNFVSQASVNGETYVCAVLHSPNEADTIAIETEAAQFRPALVESARLYQWAFSTLTVTSALDTGSPVKELRVRYSTDTDTVLLLPQDDIRAVLLVDGDPTQLRKSYDLPESVSAPIKAGTVVGSVTLSIGSNPIGTSRLVTASDVDRNPTLHMVTSVGEFFSGTYFRVLVVVAIVFAAAWAGLVALAAHSRARRKAAAAKGRAAAGQPARRPTSKKSGQAQRGGAGQNSNKRR